MVMTYMWDEVEECVTGQRADRHSYKELEHMIVYALVHTRYYSHTYQSHNADNETGNYCTCPNCNKKDS